MVLKKIEKTVLSSSIVLTGGNGEDSILSYTMHFN